MLPLWYLLFGAFLSVAAVAGNGTVIYLIATRPHLHSPTNWIIFSLAIADFLIGGGNCLTEYLFEELSLVKYELRYVVVSFLFAASALNLCLMTLNRYIAITKPLRYITLMTTRRVALLILTAWLASFVPHFIFYLKYDMLTSSKNPRVGRRFKMFDFVVFEIIPIMLLSSATGHMFYVIRQLRSRQTAVKVLQLRFNQRTEQSKETLAQNNNQRTSSTLTMMGIAVTVFVICYLNELCFTILYQLTGKKPNKIYWRISDLLYVVNSAINPVAYALFKRDIKKGLRRMFPCYCRRARREVQPRNISKAEL